MISSLRQPGEQQRLWPLPELVFTSDAQRRVYVGDFFEEAAAVLTGAGRHNAIAGDYCPDLSRAPRDWLEVKSVGASATLVLLLDRLARDAEAIKAAKASLTYVVFHHDAPVATAPRLGALRRMLAERTKSVLFVPFVQLLSICREKPPVPLTLRSEPSCGKPVETRLAYRVSLRKIRRVVGGQERMQFELPVLTERIKNFSIVGSLTTAPLPYGAVTVPRESV